MLMEHAIMLVVFALALIWGLLNSSTGMSIELAEEAAEGLRVETYEGRPARSPQEFAAAFYSDSAIPPNTVELVFRAIVRAIGSEAQRIEPDDNLAVLYPGLDMADLAYVVFRTFNCRWRGVHALDCRIETVDDFVQLATRCM